MTDNEQAAPQGRYRPLVQLTFARLREFYREPAAVFWVYGFPLILAFALGMAFRERPVERINVDAADGPTSAEFVQILKADARLQVTTVRDEEEWRPRLRSGKTDLVVVPGAAPGYEVWEEPNRPESVLARNAVEMLLVRRLVPDAPKPKVNELKEVGGRYIDFLIPGLVGVNLMGGGLFGVGFVIVDMRVRKLLKRFLATPMRRGDFLLGIMFSRLLFMVPEVLILLLFGYFFFKVGVRGNVAALFVVILLGAGAFGGLGLLVACRAKTLETVSGLMNLVMLPMYVLSGVFFSAERFPDEIQPFIKSLPLTALNDALRGIMLDGKSLGELWPQLLVLIAWGVVSYVLALRLFRWK